MIKILLLTIAIIFLPFIIFSQDNNVKKIDSFSQMDVRDWFVTKGWRQKKTITKKNKFLFVVPVIGSNPANGFFYGGGFTYVYNPKGAERFSTLSSIASYSTKGSLNLNVRSNLFLVNDK